MTHLLFKEIVFWYQPFMFIILTDFFVVENFICVLLHIVTQS